MRFQQQPFQTQTHCGGARLINGQRVQLQSLLRFDTLTAFSEWLQQPQAWVGGFDLPFGLPRELVQTLNWPSDWLACMQHFTSLSRDDIRHTFKAFCDARLSGVSLPTVPPMGLQALALR